MLPSSGPIELNRATSKLDSETLSTSGVSLAGPRASASTATTARTAAAAYLTARTFPTARYATANAMSPAASPRVAPLVPVSVTVQIFNAMHATRTTRSAASHGTPPRAAASLRRRRRTALETSRAGSR